MFSPDKERWRSRWGYFQHSLFQMEVHTLIITKQLFKNSNNIFSIIRYRKDTMILLFFQRNTLCFEPTSDSSWSKFFQSSLEKNSTPRIFIKQFFFLEKSRSHVATSSSRDNHFCSETTIFFKKIHFSINIITFE